MAERYSICQDFLVPSRYCSKVTTGDVFTPTLLILHHVHCTVYSVHCDKNTVTASVRICCMDRNMPQIAVLGITRNLYVGI